MIKKILVPTDYSKSSTNALEFALTIAVSNNASLQILHINDTVSDSEDAQSTEKSDLVREAMAGNFQQTHEGNSKLKVVPLPGSLATIMVA